MRVGSIGNDSVTDDGEWEREKHQGTSEFETIGQKCDKNCNIMGLGRFSRVLILNIPVKTVAIAYGITDHSCTLFAFVVKPESLIIVGKNKPNEYKPESIAKYADAESHILISSTPRRTSDHLNCSCSMLYFVSLKHESAPDKERNLLGVIKLRAVLTYSFLCYLAFQRGEEFGRGEIIR